MKKIIPYMLILSAMVSGCKKIDFITPNIDDGKNATIQLAVAGEGIWTVVESRSYGLDITEEKRIKSLDVLIFNSAEKLVSRQRVDNPTSLTNTFNSYSGNNMSIYVIANANQVMTGNGTPTDILGQATTVSELKNITVTNMLVDVQNNHTLMMYGVTNNVTINGGTSSSGTITVPLNYIAAKVTVNIRSNLPSGESFDLVDWKIGSLARYCYIFGRTTDAGNVSTASDFVTQTSTNSWHDATMNVDGVAKPCKSTTFYLFENRQGTTTNNDPKLKSGTSAPLRATHVLASGYYNKASGVSGIDIKLMLGRNSINDYNVERGNEYIYNVVVTSFTDFTVETRYKASGVGFQADVVNPTLDAHYDFRPLRVTAYAGVSSVAVLQADGTPAPTNFWLKVSKKNITKFVNNGSGTYVRPTYNPNTEMLLAAPVIHTNAAAMESKWAYLYAEEHLVDGATRTAKVRVTYTPTGGVTLAPIDIIINQRGILLAGNVGLRMVNSSNILTTTNYKLGIELIDEATISITPGNLSNERTMTMQFGFSGLFPQGSRSNYSLRNGYDNTLALTLTNIATGALRPPYGRASVGTISHQDYDPIYNTYSARYCFEKNRDVNGDGVIKGSEIKWYLPSNEEQLLIHAGNLAWSSVPGERWAGYDYNSSTQFTTTTLLAAYYNFGNADKAPLNLPLNARCVRQM